MSLFCDISHVDILELFPNFYIFEYEVELLFDNHKCCIEGKLGSSQLLKLVALIEEAAAC